MSIMLLTGQLSYPSLMMNRLSVDCPDLTECNYCSQEKVLEMLNLDVTNLKYMSLIHANIRGLNSKVGDLKNMTADLNQQGIMAHCIMLCETLLNYLNVYARPIPGYEMHAKNRPNGKGGGIAIYPQFRSSRVRKNLSVDVNKEYESLFVETECSVMKKRAIIGKYIKHLSQARDFQLKDIARSFMI